MSTSKLTPGSDFRLVRQMLIGAIFLCLVMQLFMVFRFEINEDEFYNLNMGYEFLRGEIHNPFQTLMFRFSGWLRFVQGNEVDQVVAGRMIIYCAAIGTCIFIYKTSRRFFSTQAALFAVLIFFGFNFVFRHLTAFRTDILVTMCLMALLWIVTDPHQTWRKAIIAGLLIGMAFALTLRSIFYVPIIAVILLGRWMTSGWSRQAFLHGMGMFVVAILSYLAIFVLHDPSVYSAEDSAGYLLKITGTSLLYDGLFNRSGLFILGLIRSFLGWSLLFLGFAITLSQLVGNHRRPRLQTIVLLSFIIPVTPIIVTACLLRT